MAYKDGPLFAVLLVEVVEHFEGVDADDVAVEHKEGLAVSQNRLSELERSSWQGCREIRREQTAKHGVVLYLQKAICTRESNEMVVRSSAMLVVACIAPHLCPAAPSPARWRSQCPAVVHPFSKERKQPERERVRRSGQQETRKRK
jgi:hypothetical protein